MSSSWNRMRSGQAPPARLPGACVGVELDHTLMGEPGLLQAERLPSSPGTDLHRRQLLHSTSRAGIRMTALPEQGYMQRCLAGWAHR